MWIQVTVLLIILLAYLLNNDAFKKQWRAYWILRSYPTKGFLPVIQLTLRAAITKPEDLLALIWETIETNGRPGFGALWLLGVPYTFSGSPDDQEADDDLTGRNVPDTINSVTTEIWCLSTPQHWTHFQVLMGSSKSIQKGYVYEDIKKWLNEGLLVSSGAKWHSRRKMLTPTFHFKILEGSFSIFNKQANIMKDKLLEQNGNPVNIDKFSTLCTLDIISEAAMGVQLNTQNNQSSQYVRDITRVSEIIVKKNTSFWLRSNLIFRWTPIGIDFYKTIDRLHRFTEEIILQRKQLNDDRTSSSYGDEDLGVKKKMAFLDRLLEMEQQNPGSFTLQDMREEVDTFLFEGHDTTSCCVNFTLYLLGLHPDIQARAHAEIAEILGDDKRDITLKDVTMMSYLERVIKESLRLYPSVPFFSRTLTSDVILKSGILLPEATDYVISPFHLHRHPDIFPNPEVFNPDRFLDSETRARHPYTYLPFSAGPRNCIGQKFAMYELKVVIATVLRHFDIKSVTERNSIKLFPFLILRTKEPLLIQFIPRINT